MDKERLYISVVMAVNVCRLVCWSLTSLCHSNGHIETMPAREINPFTALTRIRSQFLRTQWSTSNHQRVNTTTPQTAQPSGLAVNVCRIKVLLSFDIIHGIIKHNKVYNILFYIINNIVKVMLEILDNNIYKDNTLYIFVMVSVNTAMNSHYQICNTQPHNWVWQFIHM